MRKSLLSATFILFSLFFCESQMLSQNKFKNFFSKTTSVDSLAGFDEEYYKQVALEEGLYGDRFTKFMYQQKRGYVNIKFNLVKYYETPIDPQSQEYKDLMNNPVYIASKLIGGGNQVNAAPCVNEGFELGNLSGWVSSRGTNTPVVNGSCQYPVTPLALSFPTSSLQVVNTSIIDPVMGAIGASPFTGNFALKLNDNTASGNADVVRVSQTFPVTQSNFLYEFAYRAVMATAHPCCQQTFMRVSLRDFVGNLLACPLFTFAPPPPSGPICSSAGITWSNTTFGGFSVAYNPTWQKYSIDLTSYINSTVTIEVTMADCSPTAHWGYAYFDSNCGQLGVTLNNSLTIPAPSPTVNVAAQCATTATLTAPGGLGPYLWNGPGGSGITNNTNQTIASTVAGDYTLSMNPPGTCLPIVRVIKLSFPPPTTIIASPSPTICTSGTNTQVTLSAFGAASYTWQPGNLVLNIVNVSPTVTTIYTVTARTGTCVGDYTFQVTVSPDPVLNVLSSNLSLCPGQTATLTASGANTYSWAPIGLTGSLVTLTQSATTVYTTIGTSTAGCVATATTAIVSTTLLPASVIQIGGPTGTVCPGTSVTYVALNASTFTWMPTGFVGNPAVLTPTTTTTYTAIGSSGSCTNSAIFTVTVDPGPSMTVSSTPSVICPGNSATLTSVSPTALSFTWAPVASSNSFVVVTPTAPTVYSVSGTNALGCVSLFTVSPTISPVPNLTISPASPTVCFGSTLALTASGGSTYTWNPGALTGASISVGPASNTTYTLIGSNGTCTSSATRVVTVVSLPLVTAGASTTAICVGGSLTLNGGGATSYTWNPGGLTGANVTVSPAVSTIYTVTGLQGTCRNTATIAIAVNSGSALNPVASPTAVCPGGSSTLSASGATSYTWNPGALTGSTVNVTPASTTNYTVTAINVFGCTSTATRSVLVNPTPTLTITASSPSICAGTSVNYTVSGAASFTWNPGALTGSVQSFTPAINTTYTVNGTSSFGCIGQRTVSVLIVPNPTVLPVSNPTVICSGTSASLSATGATTYTWNPGALSGSLVTVSPTVNTTYTVIGRTAGCNGTSTVVVSVLNSPTLNPVASPTAICPGGTSNLSSSGALGYTWNPGNLNGASVNVSPTITTTYSVTGNNAIGCLSTRTVVLTVNPVPTVNIAASSTSVCAGSAVSYTASGATSYTWNPGGLTGAVRSFTPAGSTSYTVDGANAFGCISQRTVAVTVVPNPTPIPSVSNSSICIGNSATLSAIGAASYTWNPGNIAGTPVTVSPTLSTTYTVTGRTAGCNGTATILLNVLNGPTLTAVASPTVVCPGGLSNLTSSGALAYTWNPGNLSGASVNVNPTITTTYSVTGNNAIGCLTTRTVQVSVNPAPTVSVSASNASICVGSSVTLTASGAGFYNWSPGGLGGLSVVVSPTVTTTYTVVGTNGFGCTGQNTITIIVVPLPNPVLSANPSTICIGSSGTLTASGAASYTWFPGPLTGPTVVVSPSVNTIYTVGTFSAGCIGSNTIQLFVQNLPTLITSAVPASICPGFSSTLSASGAVNYTWNPGGLNGASVSVSPSTTIVYTLTGASAIGCLRTSTIALTVNPSPTVILIPATPTICAGSFVGIAAFGAVSYTWLPGSSTFSQVTVNPSVTTTYTVIGQNAFGCNNTANITMTVVPLPVLSTTVTPPFICVGSTSTLSASGASSYTWFPGNLSGASVTVSPVNTSTYVVIGSASACTNSSSLTVVVNTSPTVTAVASPTAICTGFSTTLTANGAASYTWNPGALVGASVSVSPAFSTIYTVTGSSAFGCVSSATIQLTVNTPPSLTVVASSPSICSGGSVALVGLGGGAISYTWFPGNFVQNGITVSPTATTIYTAIGTNSAGCSAQTTIQVLVVPTPTVNAIANPTAICVGGSSTLSASGANTYLWSTGSSFSLVLVSPSVTTTYSLLGNTGGCTSTTSVQVVVNPLPSTSITASSANICIGASGTLSASGAISYTWLPGGSTATSIVVNPSVTTIYTLQGFNAAGCMNMSTFTIQVVPTPTLFLTTSGNLVCSGSTVTLSAIGANNYTWQPGATNGNSLVTTVSAITIFTVFGESASCQSSSTIGISVLPLPVVNAVANPTAVCAGNSTTLTASGAASYTWLPMNISGAVVTNVPVGPQTYTLIGLAASGCTNSATASVIVVSPPSLSIAATSTAICSGSSATLTAAGANTYTWLPGGSNGSNLVVSPGLSITYTLNGTNASGCVNSTTFNLLVNPTPTLILSASNNTVCSGTSLTLTANGAGTYTWNPGAQTGSTIVTSPTLTTNYTVNGVSGTCSSSNTILITVLPLPIITAAASPTAVCSGLNTTLTANGASTYTWLPMNTGGASLTVTPTGSTTYTVLGQSTLGCTSSATVSIIQVFPPSLTITPSSTAICIGGSVSLTASGAGNYTWQPGNQNTASIVQNPTITSTYTVLGNSGGCLGIQTIQIVVNPLPSVTASISNAVVCLGSSVTLSSGGALTYTWNPIGQNGNSVVHSPIASLTYTVIGQDANTCVNSATVAVLVNPNPTLTASASPTAICEGALVSLSAAGANTYTWSPGNLTGALVNDSPLANTTYTVFGADANGCNATTTVAVQVISNPTVLVSPQSNTICVGNSVTLTASGANSYTWLPGGSTLTSIVESPSITTTYTLNGDNAGLCFNSFTAQIVVNPLPANVTASVAGIISCAGPTVNMFGASTDTNVSYFWTGPLSYTSNLQNPTSVGFWGNYTLTVSDNVTGCISTATVDVPTDYSIPSVTLSATSSSITCAITQVTINAAHTTTNPGFAWSGPGVVSGTTQAITTTVSGVFTVVVTDLTSSCADTVTISISTFTDVAITASIVPATCNGTITNNDGTIYAFNFGALDKFDLVIGSTYTGTATYISATGIPTNGILTNTLANPTTTVAYTLRFFDDKGCTKDTTLILTPTMCEINAFGLAKSIKSIITNDEGSYDVTVITVVKNYGTVPLTEVKLEEDLNAVFASPITYTVVTAPSITSGTSALVMNAGFDGNIETSLTNTIGSTIGIGKADTISFTVRVTPFGRFGPFSNTIKGTANSTAVPSITIVLADSSQNGINPDPDLDGNPANDNVPTTFSFTPKLFFGLTKTGEAIKSDNNSFDFRYTITVHNLGNDTLYNVNIKDSLYNKTVRLPASYSIRSGPSVSGNGQLVANSNFDGRNDVQITNSLLSKMPPGTKSSIGFVINVITDTVSVYKNSAYGTALNSQSILVSDTSGNGENPDVNNNGIWNEAIDNIPTVLVVSNPTLFIPQGFSPNGDGINETFVIKGLPDGENELVIYNRWGNKVYESADYDNTWDGSSNRGSNGSNKLPQGTYYYVLKLKGTEQKPFTGFVVLQY